MPPLARELRRGMAGPDCRAMKRALKKAGFGKGLVLTNSFGSAAEENLKRFQKSRHLTPDGVYGPASFALLWHFYDAYGRKLYSRAPRATSEDIAFAKLVVSMREMSAHTPGYQLGGGHGIPIAKISAYQKLDCSSSVSKALYDAGLFHSSVAWVSGQLESWGQPGPGKRFTVYANAEHVWIRLYGTRWWRFDTSPHGDGGRGPQLRYLPRFSSSFVARHWPGM